jgi:tetratricopeptide (TPR) repeat protein
MHYPALKFCTLVATITATIAFLLPHCSLSQATTPATAPASPPPALTKSTTYAEESIVIEQADSVYTFATDGTGLQDRTIVARVQSDAAVRSIGVVSVAYAANSQHVEFLYARVRHSDGTVVETPPTDAIEMPEPATREAPLYSDLKDKQLPIRSLHVGDTLEWKARITTTKSQAPGQFWGQESFTDAAVVLSETLELRVPVGVSVNVWSPATKPAESTSDGQHVYRWSSSHLKPTAGKEVDAATEAKKKVVWTADQELDTEQGKLPSVAWTTFKSWDEVGAWYRSLEADRATPSPEIKAKVAELIAGKSTDEDKARALYSYVATQIRYIGVDFGIGRYQPHTAAEILTNQYGDCKDKHTLLAAMLSAVGIQSDAVLVGAGVRFNSAVPSPAAFNHVITHLTLAGQTVWLDTTVEIAPWRMLVPIVRDKQALVVPTTAAAHLDRTPADPPFASFQTMDAVGTLDKDGVSHSRLTLVVRGDVELTLRAAFHLTAPAQYNDLVQQIVHNIGYAGTTSNPEITRPDDTTQPFKFSFDYEREKAGDWENYKIIPQVAPVSLPRFGDTDPLVRILDLGYPRVEISKSAMKLPDGWGTILPGAVHYKCPYATYDETYRFEKGTVYAERRIEVLKQKVPPADLAIYKKWANDADLGNELYIQLTRTSASVPEPSASALSQPGASTPTPTAGPPIVSPGSEEVATLLQKAIELYQQQDYDGVAKLLDQIKAINPQQPYLWFTYGEMAVMHGQFFEAIDDLKKEIKLHPESLAAYRLLTELQKSRGLKKDAINTLRAWTTADPSDPSPTEKLMDMLLVDGDVASAMAAGESALAHLSEDARKGEAFQLALGRAQLEAGSKDKGTATLQAVLKSSQTPEILSAASNALADASIDLPEAERTDRATLDKLTEDSNSLTLDGDPTKFKEQSHLIAAAWDSLGWTLFREGKSAEAESYLRASWIAEVNPETSKHLSEVASAQGYKPELDESRKLPLGSANGRNGVAEYRILVRSGKFIDIKPTGDKTIPEAQDLIVGAEYTGLFPAGSQVTLVYLGFINCHSGVCELILEP